VPALTRGLVRRDVLRPADAAFVLGSRLQKDGELTAESMTRLLHALEVVAQGHASRIVLSEAAPPAPQYLTPARQLIARLGLRVEVVAVGPIANTHDEAVAASRLFAERGWRSVVVVTSPAHSRRASATFEKVGLLVISSPCTETRYDIETLDRADERLAAFSSVMHERIGLWVYKRRGWI
jgi:uncharacterized SAM-binding protein YcdF (DUF218 family)